MVDVMVHIGGKRIELARGRKDRDPQIVELAGNLRRQLFGAAQHGVKRLVGVGRLRPGAFHGRRQLRPCALHGAGHFSGIADERRRDQRVEQFVDRIEAARHILGHRIDSVQLPGREPGELPAHGPGRRPRRSPADQPQVPQGLVDVPHALDGAREDSRGHALRLLLEGLQRRRQRGGGDLGIPVTFSTVSPSPLSSRASWRVSLSRRAWRSAMSTAVFAGRSNERRMAAVAARSP